MGPSLCAEDEESIWAPTKSGTLGVPIPTQGWRKVLHRGFSLDGSQAGLAQRDGVLTLGRPQEA